MGQQHVHSSAGALPKAGATSTRATPADMQESLSDARLSTCMDSQKQVSVQAKSRDKAQS